MIKIRLTTSLPIPDAHKCFKGTDFTVYAKKGRRQALYYFKDHQGTECGAFRREFDIIEGDERLIPINKALLKLYPNVTRHKYEGQGRIKELQYNVK